MQQSMVFARVHPPRPLTSYALEAFLLRLSSDPTHALVVFELRGRPAAAGGSNQVSYWLGAQPEHLRWVRRTLHDLLPGTIIQASPQDDRAGVTSAGRLVVRPRSLALATERPEITSLAILSALNQRLDPDDELVIQLVVGPRRSPTRRRGPIPDPTRPWWHAALFGAADAPAGTLKQHDTRAEHAGMATCIRFGVTAATSERRHRLLVGLLGGFSTAKTPGTFLSLRREAASHLDEARPPLRWDITPAASELVGLLAWPLGEQELPGLPPMHPRQLPVSAAVRALRERRRVLGLSTVPGDPVPVALPATDGLFHLIATGPTGSGKSTVLLHLIAADIAAGYPVAVIDPKWQLVRDVVHRAVPEERIPDVVILDPSDERVPGFNPLDAADRDPDVVVDGLLAVFAAVFADGWGPRTQDITHAGLLTLARVGAARAKSGDEPFTLLDLPRLFTDAAFRRSVIGGVGHDPGLAAFWGWYQAQSPASQTAAIAAPANKWRQYLLRPSVRRILGQPRPRFRLRDLFRNKQIVLVPLNDGLIGPITAQLLGGLVAAELWTATLERAKEANPAATPGSIWIDEAQNFMHLPTALDQALAASRSMGVSWGMAHQFRAQMPKAMLAAVDANARNKIVFRPGDPSEAAAYARMAPDLDTVDFMSLGKFEAYATVMAASAPQPWCSLRTQPLPEPTGLGDRIRTESSNRYGSTPPTGTTPSATPVAGDISEMVGRKRKGTSQ